MQDLGLMFRIFSMFIKLVVKPFLKILKFIGAYWIIICLAPFILIETVTGRAIQRGTLIDNISNVFFYLSFVFMLLTTIQNLIRLFIRDNTFNIYKLIYRKITGRELNVGFTAKVKGISADNLKGIVFGKIGTKYVNKDESEMGSTLIIGGSRSGKTSGIAIPTLMSWKGNVFAIDIKGELYSTTSKTRNVERIKRFNPCEEYSYGYNPYYVLENGRNIVQSANQIALAIIPLSADVKDPFWITQAQAFLTGAILFYYDYGLSFSDTMIKIKSQSANKTVTIIMESNNEKAKSQMSQFVGMDDKTLSGIFAEVSRNIMVFATDDDLIRVLNGKGKSITPQDLEDGYDIYCCIEEHLIEQWKPLLTLICNQFFKFFEQRKLGNDKPILFLLDEFPRLGKIESITGGLSTLAGRGVHMCLVIQSKSQLNAIYGKDNANIIVDNCNYKAILKATEPETQKWCSDLVGTHDKKKTSSNYNADMVGIGKGTGTSRTTEEKRIIKPEEFGYMAEKGYLILLAPTGYKKINRIKYWEDNAFKNR